MLVPSLLAGGAFGAKHAVEADHIAAVATLVEEEDRPGIVGAAWGIGHSLPILGIGGLFVLLGLQLPSTVATAFEIGVGIILIGLGLRVLAGRPAIVRHSHHGAEADAEQAHAHVEIAGIGVGFGHTHTGAHTGSFGIGIVHGFAGSGGLVVALAAAAPSVATGVTYLLAFAIASIVTMAVGARLWGTLVERIDAAKRIAGAISVAVGLLLLAAIAGLPVPV